MVSTSPVYVKHLSSLEFLFIVLLTFNQSKIDAFIIVDISNEDDFDLNAMMPEESAALTTLLVIFPRYFHYRFMTKSGGITKVIFAQIF